MKKKQLIAFASAMALAVTSLAGCGAFCALRRSQMRFRTAALRSITAACF